jgi:hypothetical protein
MIHGENSRNQKNAHLNVGYVDWHYGRNTVSLACEWQKVAGGADRWLYDRGELFLEHCNGGHAIAPDLFLSTYLKVLGWKSC